MEYTFKDLNSKTVAQLKEIAKGLEHEAVKGYTQLNKADLLKAVCTALELDTHERHEVKGLDKAQIKSQIKKLKVERDKALKAHDHKQLKTVRTQIKRLKKTMRKAMV
ncbi:MAG: hypothetical protein ACE5I1_01360 [bacterium]